MGMQPRRLSLLPRKRPSRPRGSLGSCPHSRLPGGVPIPSVGLKAARLLELPVLHLRPLQAGLSSPQRPLLPGGHCDPPRARPVHVPSLCLSHRSTRRPRSDVRSLGSLPQTPTAQGCVTPRSGHHGAGAVPVSGGSSDPCWVNAHQEGGWGATRVPHTGVP